VLAQERLAKFFADAVGCFRQGRRAEAESLCRRVLALAPDHAQALVLLGRLALDAGRPDDALAPLSRAAALLPGNAVPLQLLGAAYLALRRDREAQGCLERAVALDPSLVQAHVGLAGLFSSQGRMDAAIEAYRTALRLNPDDVFVEHELGVILARLQRAEEAIPHFRACLQRRPDLLRARHNLGSALSAAGRWDEALAEIADTARRAPGDGEARHNLAVTLLRLGRLAEGWPHFEARWQLNAVRPFQRPFAQPQWRGEELSGRILLLHEEQGFGDTLQFCRYIPLLRQGGATLLVEARRELASLLGASFAAEGVTILPRAPDYPGSAGLPVTDYHLPVMSLPGIFGTRLETIPADIPYLRASPAKTDAWAHRLAALPRPRIGLVWAGNKAHSKDSERSIALALLEPLGRIPGAIFLSLQQGDAAAEIPPPGLVLHEKIGALGDFDETAAVLGAVDLVITVDTAMAHLAGGLGKNIWLLDRHLPDWRWLLDRTDSPWYPTMRIFRQARPGDWGSVVAPVAAALDAYCAGRLK
jgi:tetratricopeptide (TPR) repeat protein